MKALRPILVRSLILSGLGLMTLGAHAQSTSVTQQFLGAPAFGGQGAVQQGEDQGRDHRREHAQGGAHRVFRQVGRCSVTSLLR